MLQSLVSWTTDLGTEYGFADVCSPGFFSRIQAAFPVAEITPDEGEPESPGDHDSNAAARAGPPSSDTSSLFTRALPIPGMCHVIDNLSFDVHCQAFRLWPKFKDGLDSICCLLCSPSHCP
eukprot:8647431-Alexandrium_andersonii.AAC.1